MKKSAMGRAVLIVTLVAVPMASYWLVFRPQNDAIGQARQEIEHKQTMLAKLREETSRNADLERANEEIKRGIETIEARLPNSKELDTIVRQVSDLAVQSGLSSPQMKSAKPVKAVMYMEQPLELSMSGDFKRFYEFLIRVEQLPRITRIPDMKIKRMDDADGNMKAEFTLSIYFQDNRGDQK